MKTIPQEFLELMERPWRAQPEPTLGGWCVTLAEDPRTTSEGALAIAMFLSKEVAEHIAAMHNVSLETGPRPVTGFPTQHGASQGDRPVSPPG